MAQVQVVYFNVADTLEYEKSLLQKWGIDNLDLIEAKDCGQSFAERAGGADGAVVEYEQVTDDVMGRLANCKIIALQSIGYNNIDIAAATKHQICVTNAPGFCTEEVALHSVGLIIDLVRNISYHDRAMRAGNWSYEAAPKTTRLSGKTAGLVYFGSIPKAMTPMLKAMGLRVLVYAPTKSAEYLARFGAEKSETLEELLQTADFVSLHMPLHETTRHMIGEEQLKMMKKSAFLINTARGAVVDEPALVRALRDGTIAGAGIDVFEDEANQKTELTRFENVVITPHTAFLSEDSFYGAREIALRQIVDCLVLKRAPQNLVNKELANIFQAE